MKQDDDDIDREITTDKNEDLGESTLSSDIEEDDLDIRQEVPHLDQERRDKTLRTSMVPLPMKRSRADAVIARSPLPNLQHLAGVIAPPLLKRQKSVINISRESDVVQAHTLPKAGGDQNIPQSKAGGDDKFPQHQKATFEVAK
jgi:hypothetical protein